MSENIANIAQLELLLYTPNDLENIISETMSRAIDGKRNKLVIRIFDTNNVLTKHVRLMQALEIRSEAFYQWLPADFLQRPFLERLLIDWRRRRVATKNLDARKKLTHLALTELRATIKYEGPIGIEDYPGEPFRLARHNELNELLEAAGRAQGTWAFIFKPNELLADRNTLIVSAF